MGLLSCLLWLLGASGEGRGAGWGWTGLEVGAPGLPELALLEEFGGHTASGNPLTLTTV